MLSAWTWALGGALAAWSIGLLVARKWKLARAAALPGAGGAALAAALPFVAVYAWQPAPWLTALALLGQVILALALSFGLLMVAFWRDPERVAPETEGVILSPADGQVLYIKQVADGDRPLVEKDGRAYLLDELTGLSAGRPGCELARGPALVIGVEMSFLDVHVNRCPLAGRVQLVRHIPGRFVSLRREEAPFVNERLTTVIAGAGLDVAVVQVASRLVRRIQSFLAEGQMVGAGQRLGMIRLGSLVAVVLPAEGPGLRITVAPGAHVKAGISILARYEPSVQTI